MLGKCSCDARDPHRVRLDPAVGPGLAPAQADPRVGPTTAEQPSRLIADNGLLEPSQFSHVQLVVWKLTRQICKDFPCLVPVSIPQGDDAEQESRVGQ